MELGVGGQVIRTTAEHPIYVGERGWVAAGELQLGDLLTTHDGRGLPVSFLRPTGAVVHVYNFRVADHHTYFVGGREWGFSVWAHNSVYQSVMGDEVVYVGVADTGAGSSYARRYAAALKRTPNATTRLIAGTEALSPQDSFAVEQALIHYYGRKGIDVGGTLLNNKSGKYVSAANTAHGYRLLNERGYWSSGIMPVQEGGSGI